MKLNDLKINENCENRLKPLYYFKCFVENQKENYIKKLKNDFFDRVTANIDWRYRNSVKILITSILDENDLIDKDIVIANFLKYSETNKLEQLSKNSLVIKQSVKKFFDFSEIERKEVFKEIAKIMQKEEWNYYEVLENKMKDFFSLDDVIYNTIINEKYSYIKCPKMEIFLYNSGLSITFLDNNKYSIIRRTKEEIEFIIKYIDLTKLKIIENDEQLKKNNYSSYVVVDNIYYEINIGFINIIKALLRIKDKLNSCELVKIAISRNYIIDNNCRKDTIHVAEEINQNKKYYFDIAKFFNGSEFMDKDMVIEFSEKAIKEGVPGAYFLLSNAYIKDKQYSKAREYLEEAFNKRIQGSFEKLQNLNSRENELKKYKYRKDFIDEKFDFIFKEFEDITRKECYTMNIKEDVVSIKDSKIYGEPYLPLGEEYPLGKDGNPLPLLIQINFEDINFILPGYPNKGILEVFADKEISYPLDYEIRYYEDINLKYQTIFPEIDVKNFIVNKPLKLINFRKEVTYMPVSDYRFNKILKSLLNKAYENEEMLKEVKSVLKQTSDKYSEYNGKLKKLLQDDITNKLACQYYHSPLMIGGYADFTQYDIRAHDEKEKTESLIKIDSNIRMGDKYPVLNIGDGGIINVLISKKDLKEKNFKNAIVTWDCC